MRYNCCTGLVLLIAQTALAQQAIQQPIVETTAIGTTVLVPDRGTTYIGGVTSAQSGRVQYGPFRPGTAMGFSRQTNSVTATVRIIDLNEMDQAILNSTPGVEERIRPDFPRVSSRAMAKLEPDRINSDTAQAAKFEKLAQEAERSGKSSIAKLYRQAAERHGSKSKLPSQKIDAFVPPSPTPTPAIQQPL